MGIARDRGLGAECASLQEAKHALSLGITFSHPLRHTKDFENVYTNCNCVEIPGFKGIRQWAFNSCTSPIWTYKILPSID